MPRLVDLGPGYGTVAFPDDATDEQIVAQYDQLEAERNRTLRLAEMVTRQRVDEAELEQPSIGKTLIRAGTALREQTPGALKQIVGNVTRTLADAFTVPREAPTDPEHPLNILREAGIDLERQGREQRDTADELGRSVGGGVPAAVAESLAGTAGISATALPAAVFGLGPAAAAAAVQQYGLTLSEFKDTLRRRNPQLSDEEAFRQAQGPAALTGAATGLLTRTFGGAERFIARIVKDGLGKEGVKGLLRQMWQSASMEFPEEYGDQLAQGFVEKAFVNPDKSVGDIFNEAGLAGLAGFALGGLTAGAIGGPVVAGEAAGRAVERSRVRRESARESEERIKRVIAQRESEQANAQETGTTTTAAGQAQGAVGQTPSGVRVRLPTEDGLETEEGTDLENIPAPPPELESRLKRIDKCPDGLCFSNAAKWVNKYERDQGIKGRGVSSDARVVHGKVIGGPERKLMDHAWVEIGDTVVDPTVGIQVPKSDYYRFLSANPESYYTGEQATINSIRLKNQGPWTVDEVQGRRATPPDVIPSPRPVQRIPIQIQSADGSIRNGEFTGYYDMRDYGGKLMASIGWTLPNGSVTHGVLREDEKIIGTIPTFEEWSKSQANPETFGKQWMVPDEESKHLKSQLGNIITLEQLLKIGANTASKFNPRIEQGIRYLHEMVVNQSIAGLGEQGIKLTFNDNTGSEYSPRTNTININPSSAGARTVMHEAVHGLSARYLNRFLGSHVRQGKELQSHLKKSLKDKAVPEPVKELINIYLAAAKALGIEKDLFGGRIQSAVESRTHLASIDLDGDWSISTGENETIAKLRDKLARAYGPVDYITNSLGELVLKISPEQMERMKADGIAESASGTSMVWVRVPEVVKTTSKGVAGTGMLAQATASAGLPYGMANLDEFLAEAFSNEEFQLLLDSIPSTNGKSLWSRFMDWLKSIFPFFSEEPTLLADTIAVGEEIFKRTIELQNVPYESRKYDKSRIQEEQRLPAPPKAPQFFQTQAQVQQAIDNPGITALQQQQARDLAAVQSSMSPDGIVGWLMASPADKYNAFAQRRLAYIEDRRHLSSLQRALVSMPENTEEETRAKQVAGAQILGHYGVDRTMERTINAELLADQDPYAKAVAKLSKLTNAQLKANFLTGLFNRLTKDYRVYLQNLTAAAPAAQNLQAQWRQRIADAERRLNEHAASPTALKHALSAIASMLPPTITTNQDIVTWAITTDVLNGVVGQDVRNWLLVDDGTGSPALLGYGRLVEDMAALRDILANQQTLAQDIEAFKNWFSASGTSVSPKRFAEAYFKFRTGRDRAIKLAAGIERQIETLDLRIRGNTIARDRLQEMMTNPEYVATVREAARIADVVVRALYDSQDNRTGLIERDKTVGRWRMTGPQTNTEYVVDLYPSSAQEAVNRGQLTAFVTEARAWATANKDTDPLLADEYENLSDYIEKYLVHPSLDPIQGFIQEPWMQIPGTRIRIPTDPFDVWSKVTGPLFRTIRDTLERIGGRVTKQAILDSHELDRVMRRIDGLNHNPKFGFQAQTQAILKAMKSHGWTNEQFARWDEDVAERILAAGQNNLGPSYEVGDRIVGSGVVVTSEDMAAIRIMKQWQDAVLSVAPKSVMEQLANIGISRKAIALGRLTMARTAAPWTNEFSIQWLDATDDRSKLRLLSEDRVFRRVIMGYIGEFNPELNKMNPANDHKSPLFEIYRRMAMTEKQGVDTFESLDEVLDYIANEMVAANMSPDFTTARTSAQNTLLAEVKAFIKSFQDNILNYKTDQTYGGLPPSVIQVATANNSFTNPRGLLVAPSTFYTYSVANDGARLKYVGNLRSFLNLRLLQSGKEAVAALNVRRTEYEDRIKDEMRTGLSRRKSTRKILDQSIRDKKSSQIRYDYKELVNAIAALERVFGALERFEGSTVDHYEHAGVAALNNVFGTVKAFLLSSTQAMTTNFWSGSLLGPAIFHWQTGQYLKALFDVVPAPHMWRTLIRKVSDAVASNPMMSRLLRVHAPLWDTLAENVIKASVDWRRIQQIAETSGMVAPYNLRKVFANKAALKRTAGRLDTDNPQPISDFFNFVLSMPGARHVSETIKAGFPRLFDNMINYSLITAFEQDMKFLAKNGWSAFKAREDAAPPGHDWQDLSNPDNILKPGDIGLKSYKGLERYQQLFAPLGSLDRVLLDYYNRTRGMTKEQREDEPLIDSQDDYTALALEYAAITNVATETRRSFTLKGKGSDGVWRNFIGTFQGWVTNMTKQFSKALQSHSKDKNFVTIANNMAGLGVIIVLLSAVGAWNWEFGDELTKLLYNQSSARIQPGNIKDAEDAVMYFVQALVNTVPIYGPFVGNLAGLAFTGRGKPFDPASLMPAVGFALGTYETVKRIVQTGDVVLPMVDWSRNWMPFSKIAINRAPLVQGLVEQQNAVRSLNGSAPGDVEIKWGQRSGGDVRYSPVNDEVMKLISSAYDVVSRGGSIQVVRDRMQDVITAYQATGRSRDEAVKLAASALASKEPIRILTGREMVPEEEKRWLSRMTSDQKKDYSKAVAAWKVLSQVTGRDLNMVTTQAAVGTGGGGGGGGGGYANLSPVTGLRITGGRRGGVSRLRRGRSSRSRLLRTTSVSRGRGPRVSLRRRSTRRRLAR